MSSFVASNAASSGAAGAKFGYQVGGGYGAIIGGILGTIGGFIGGRQQQRRQERLKQYQKNATNVVRHISRLQQVNEAMKARAGVANAAVATGAGRNSSGIQGVLSSVGTQAAANIANNQRMTWYSDTIAQAKADASKATWDQQIMGLIGGDTGTQVRGMIDSAKSDNPWSPAGSNSGSGGSSGGGSTGGGSSGNWYGRFSG